MGTSVTLVAQYGNPTFSSLIVNGPSNISGSFFNSGSISATNNLSIAGTASFDAAKVKLIGGTNFNENIRCSAQSNDYSSLILGAVAGDSGTGAGQWSLVRWPSANSYKFTIRYNSTDNLTVDTSGNLTMAGNSSAVQMYATDWFRSYNSTGWYNQTYAGGIYMTDSTWIRTYNSKYFYVDSYIACGGDITAYYSDERLKKDIVKIDGALAKVMALDGVYYTPNDFAMEQKVERKQDRKVGVIAQNVQKVLPEVVSIAAFDLDENLESKSGENYLTVKYDKLVPLLIEAIKEQQAQIEELKSKIG